MRPNELLLFVTGCASMIAAITTTATGWGLWLAPAWLVLVGVDLYAMRGHIGRWGCTERCGGALVEPPDNPSSGRCDAADTERIPGPATDGDLVPIWNPNKSGIRRSDIEALARSGLGVEITGRDGQVRQYTSDRDGTVTVNRPDPCRARCLDHLYHCDGCGRLIEPWDMFMYRGEECDECQLGQPTSL